MDRMAIEIMKLATQPMELIDQALRPVEDPPDFPVMREGEQRASFLAGAAEPRHNGSSRAATPQNAITEGIDQLVEASGAAPPAPSRGRVSDFSSLTAARPEAYDKGVRQSGGKSKDNLASFHGKGMGRYDAMSDKELDMVIKEVVRRLQAKIGNSIVERDERFMPSLETGGSHSVPQIPRDIAEKYYGAQQGLAASASASDHSNC